MRTLFLKISNISYSQSSIQRNLSLEIKCHLWKCPPYLYYIFLYYNYYFSQYFLFPPSFCLLACIKCNINR